MTAPGLGRAPDDGTRARPRPLPPSYRELARSYGIPARQEATSPARPIAARPSRRRNSAGWFGTSAPVRRRRVVAAVLVVALGLLGSLGWSYARALTGPGNDALSIRSTEWLKDHGMAWAVNDVERWWYTHHKPRVGGVPTGALGHALQAGATARPRAGGGPAPAAAPTHLPAPAPVTPIASPALPGEGQWRPLGQPVHGVTAMYAAYVRPDTVHTSLLAAVAWMDPTLVRAVGYAGVLEPGGQWQEQAPIAEAARPTLLAAFNSGFKMRDAKGGYYADGRLARPLVNGAATLVIDGNGTPTVGMWGRDVRMGPDVIFARQNLSLIVDGGQPVPGLAANSNDLWGATVGNNVYVWRSGLGVTATGALIYAAGNGLSAATLASVLARAGAVRAMELDINSAWVDFFTYAPAATGAAASQLQVDKLLPDMRPSTGNYLTASSRDFIAVFRRP